MRRFAFSSALLLALACETLIGAEFDDVHRRRAPADAGSEDGASEDAGGDASGCNLLKPPAPPTVTETPGDVQFTNVIASVDYGDDPVTDTYFDTGYDLDDRCTNRGDPPACLPAAWTSGDPTDGTRGQDNGVGKLLAMQTELFGITATSSSEETVGMRNGTRAPFGVLRVSGFGGFSEDEKVRVEWLSGVAFNLGQGSPAPKFDGNDSWPVAAFVSDADAGALDAGVAPTVVVDEAAYVTLARVVARFPALRVPLGNVWFDVKDVVLTAKLDIDPLSGKRRLTEGVVAGRAEMDELLRVIPYITKSLLQIELCTDNPNYPVTKRFICSAADIPIGNFVPPSGLCEGISFGLRFQGDPAVIGSTLATPPLPAYCPLATDPASDSCAIPAPGL